MTLLIDGVDVSSFFDEETLKVWMEPVISRTVTTLDGISHSVVRRWRSKFTVRALYMTRVEALSLQQKLHKSTISVTYENPHLSTTTVTQNMVGSSTELDTALRYGSLQYWDGGVVTFNER